MLRRVSQFKTNKDLFNNIEEEWEQSYFIEDDFARKEDTPATTTEVDEVHTWNETTIDNPVEAEILAEVNELYHKYGRYPTHRACWKPIRDQMQNAHMYIMEYSATLEMEKERRYVVDKLGTD